MITIKHELNLKRNAGQRRPYMLKSTYQHTVKAAFSVTGIGVHSGVTATLKIKPAPASSGITFIRTDVKDRLNTIPARWDNVTETQLCTIISNDAGVTVSTIEHVLSAFAAVGLDNAFVEIDGPEIPIMDGSAICFLRAIEKIGLTSQNAARRVLKIKKAVTYQEGDKIASFSPSENQTYSFEIAFNNALIGTQTFTHEMQETSYRNDIASARTFGFLHEVEQLKKMGFARGGSLDNAVVVDGDNVLNPDGLRFKNEFVRHKILDAIGDIYLAGAQVIGHYHGVKAGHAMNNKILRALFVQPDAYEFVDLEHPVSSRKTASSGTYQVALTA